LIAGKEMRTAAAYSWLVPCVIFKCNKVGVAGTFDHPSNS